MFRIGLGVVVLHLVTKGVVPIPLSVLPSSPVYDEAAGRYIYSLAASYITKPVMITVALLFCVCIYVAILLQAMSRNLFQDSTKCNNPRQGSG